MEHSIIAIKLVPGSALPPVAAVIALLQRLQQLLQPYVERYQAVQEAVQEWWALRVERCAHATWQRSMVLSCCKSPR